MSNPKKDSRSQITHLVGQSGVGVGRFLGWWVVCGRGVCLLVSCASVAGSPVLYTASFIWATKFSGISSAECFLAHT